MHPGDLFNQPGVKHVAGPPSPPVTDITDDSRLVRPGGLFVSRGRGTSTQSYISQAVQQGAAAVVSEPIEMPQWPDAVSQYQAATVDQRLAGLLAEAFFAHPAQRLDLIGVTGTNGKTTITLLIQHLLQASGIQAGVIGTIYTDDGTAQGRRPSKLTTPGAIEFSRELARMTAAGCKAVAIEASSHALEQGRVAVARFRSAVFTNLTQDHLDYHESMEAYADAKSVLFQQLDRDGVAVANHEDPYTPQVLSGYTGRVLTTSMKADATAADCFVDQIQLRPDSSRARFVGPWGEVETPIPLIGMHNVCNLLQSLAVAYELTGKLEPILEALKTLPQVPGRLERVKASAPGLPVVLVDYAHTPDALHNVLSALRPLTAGQLIVLFGCGGDRDKTKRPLMAQAACEFGDRVYLTSDNPRTEDPEAIIRDAYAGVPDHSTRDMVILTDRAEAIRSAIQDGRQGDTVLLAGKGHEDYQTIGETDYHFDDREHAAAALAGHPASGASK